MVIQKSLKDNCVTGLIFMHLPQKVGLGHLAFGLSF